MTPSNTIRFITPDKLALTEAKLGNMGLVELHLWDQFPHPNPCATHLELAALDTGPTVDTNLHSRFDQFKHNWLGTPDRLAPTEAKQLREAGVSTSSLT